MADRVPARLTAGEGRRFALTVGLAFIVFAVIAWLRHHPLTGQILGALGAALVLAGLVIPTRLGPVQRGWMGLAHAISKVTTPIVMGVMYFVVFGVMGLLRRTFGGNPLVHAEKDKGYWRDRAPQTQRSNMSRQF